ncbi:MAG: hypothetical protein GX121_02410 [Ignavibacteria bacterium]|nr:hypothetical protein [Ignavibacteria bacterium]
MKKKYKYILLLALIITLYSCKEEGKDYLVLGTFNVEWLGDGVNDRVKRSESDYKNIAELILDTESDIIGLQEVENDEAILRLLKYLPDYKAIVSSGGNQQKVAFLYNSSLQIKDWSEYSELAIEGNRTRPGLVLSVQKKNFKCAVMVVHLKSTSRYDDTKEKKERSQNLRESQAQVISNWADSMIANNIEKNLVILGDFNDTPTRKINPTLKPLMDNKSLFFLTTSLKSCKYPTWYVIDHVLISESMKRHYEENSVFFYDFRSKFSDLSLKMISDHCPITARFRIEK